MEFYYLIILVQRLKIARVDKSPRSLITQANSIVEITMPYDRIMIVYGSVALEAKAVAYSPIISIPFFIIGKASCQVGS